MPAGTRRRFHTRRRAEDGRASEGGHARATGPAASRVGGDGRAGGQGASPFERPPTHAGPSSMSLLAPSPRPHLAPAPHAPAVHLASLRRGGPCSSRLAPRSHPTFAVGDRGGYDGGLKSRILGGCCSRCWFRRMLPQSPADPVTPDPEEPVTEEPYHVVPGSSLGDLRR